MLFRSLGDEAIAAGSCPVDRAEWLPFLEGYLWVGNEAKAGDIVDRITDDAPLAKEICDALESRQFRFGETIQRAIALTLCTM